MKKAILSAAIMLASVGAYAQHAVGSITLQPKVGINTANVTDAKDTDPRVGLAAGLEAEYQVTDLLSLSAGAIYSQQAIKRTGQIVALTTQTQANWTTLTCLYLPMCTLLRAWQLS